MGFDLSFFPQRSIGSTLLELLTFCAFYLIAKQVPRKKNVKFIDTIFFTIHISGKFILQNLKKIYIYLKHTNAYKCPKKDNQFYERKI